jgi:hypothetical protein
VRQDFKLSETKVEASHAVTLRVPKRLQIQHDLHPRFVGVATGSKNSFLFKIFAINYVCYLSCGQMECCLHGLILRAELNVESKIW